MLAWPAGGCTPSGGRLHDQFQHEDPAVRLEAVRTAGATRDAGHVPYLVDRLTDSETDVRFFAILALDRITGKRMGYRYYETPEKRSRAVRRWRNWLADRRSAATKPEGKAN